MGGISFLIFAKKWRMSCKNDFFWNLTTCVTKTEEQQVLSILDHVLANEDDERPVERPVDTLRQTNSITNKKDSGYGSQGHLKLEVE